MRGCRLNPCRWNFCQGSVFPPSLGAQAPGFYGLWTATGLSPFPVAVPPSAYPTAFPWALAAETIPFLTRIRWTPAPGSPTTTESQ